MESFKFRGFMSPVFTPFNNDKEQSLNLRLIPEYAEFLNKNGIKGILVNGTSGEGVSMSVTERIAATEAWVNVAKSTKQTLMVQVGGAPLPDVIQMAKHAASLNVDSILCLPELFFKPTTVDDLIDYLQIVSSAAPNTPLLYYHIPGFTGVNINMADFLSKAMTQVKTLVGIKFTSLNLEEGAACLALPSYPVVFLGADRIMAGAFQMGFDSVIATSLNMLPTWSTDILERVTNGEPSKALAAQQKLTKAVDIITENGSWVSTMKAAMKVVTGFDFGAPRPPLKELSLANHNQMKTKFAVEGFL